jgi:hypothetical protein
VNQPERDLDEEIEYILSHPQKRAYRDLRDRAAYMYVTGTYPSHLRTFFTRVLGRISKMANRATSMDRRSGNMLLDEDKVRRLHLDDHPMVLKVRKYLDQGYRITVSRGATSRMSYRKIYLSKGDDEITVQIDGSRLDHWK